MMLSLEITYSLSLPFSPLSLSIFICYSIIASSEDGPLPSLVAQPLYFLPDEPFCGLAPPLVLALSLGPFPDSDDEPSWPFSCGSRGLLTSWFAGLTSSGFESCPNLCVISNGRGTCCFGLHSILFPSLRLSLSLCVCGSCPSFCCSRQTDFARKEQEGKVKRDGKGKGKERKGEKGISEVFKITKATK